ncbi:Sodium/hydrogen exchanger family-domain-containing protein [Hyaloraphidium curvatum]|nr:Sodium/hydrogen exchanger family-domain-containing protein [Hyaloraphidium curvatum]
MSTGATNSVFDGDGVTANAVELLFVQLLLILSFTRVVALVMRLFRQPDVMAEVIGGILLGPTAMGAIPGFSATIFPPATVSNTLTGIANLGLVLFLFSVGCDLDFKHLKSLGVRSVVVSLGSIILPMGLGFAVAVPLWNNLMPPQDQTTSFGVFAFFIAVAMSISALPVLARLLGELGIGGTAVGVAALASAVADDMVAWCLLAVVVSLTSLTGTPINALYTLLCIVGLVVALMLAVRPALDWGLKWYFDPGRRGCGIFCPRKRSALDVAETTTKPDDVETQKKDNEVLKSDVVPTVEEFGQSYLTLETLALACMLAILNGWITEFIGADCIFGAFWTGVAMPRTNGFAREIVAKLHDLLIVVFLPVYFCLSGLNTNIQDLNTGMAWAMVVLVTVCACAGKFIGATVAARLQKIPWRESCAIGVLLNTKGLVELVVLNVGLGNGTINGPVFAVMVLMAIITSLLTAPVIRVIYPESKWRDF